jgi:hypothetical protein
LLICISINILTKTFYNEFKEQELWDALEIDTEAKNEEKVLSISRHTGVLRKVIRQLVEDGFIQEKEVKVYRKA